MRTQPADSYIKPSRYHVFPTGEDNEAAMQEPGLMTGSPLPSGMPLSSSIAPIPASQQSHLRSGLELYAQGETLNALWAFFEGVGTEPQNALGHYLCGLAYQALELAEEAQAAWATVVTLTSGEGRASRETLPDSEPHSEMQWVRSMAERLIRKGASSPSSKMPLLNDSLNPGSESGETLSSHEKARSHQETLEASILEAVGLYGNCYVKDRHIAKQLAFTTEEEIIGWKQSFSTRKGLEYCLYQNAGHQESRHEGVIFSRSPASAV